MKFSKLLRVVSLVVYFGGGDGLVTIKGESEALLQHDLNWEPWTPLPYPNIFSPQYLIQLARHEKFIVQLILYHFEELGYENRLENFFHPELFDGLRK